VSRILTDFPNSNKPTPQKSLTIRRPRQTFAGWREDHPIAPRMALVRAAHVFASDKGSVVVARSQQAVKTEANGAKVIFHSGSQFLKAQEKPALKGLLNVLEGKRAA
jgi:hypothetical protein